MVKVGDKVKIFSDKYIITEKSNIGYVVKNLRTKRYDSVRMSDKHLMKKIK